MVASAHDTLPPAADEAPVCDDENCSAPATLSYRWDWGATGVCCAEHAALAQQKSTALSRSVAIHPMQAAAPPSLTRDERVQYKATILTLEEDLKAAQSSGQQIHQRHQDLQVQLSAKVTKERELRAQLEDAGVKLSETARKLDDLSAENGRLLVELDRLKHLDALVTERAEREAHERGIEGGHVVDG